jgi:hypothetical protein
VRIIDGQILHHHLQQHKDTMGYKSYIPSSRRRDLFQCGMQGGAGMQQPFILSIHTATRGAAGTRRCRSRSNNKPMI